METPQTHAPGNVCQAKFVTFVTRPHTVLNVYIRQFSGTPVDSTVVVEPNGELAG